MPVDKVLPVASLAMANQQSAVSYIVSALVATSGVGVVSERSCFKLVS
ncbi:hypothetical protein OH492_24125 [Vibrio chagasii]|nr:hypothetical protein [Vibrio chagasii]